MPHYDLPFVYVFDADALVDTQSYSNLSVPMLTGTDFILRRIAGRQTCAATIRTRDAAQANRQSLPFAMPRDYVVVPDLLYPPDSQIGFDLGIVLRGNWPYAVPGSIPNYWSQIAFQGVRRFHNQQAPETTYRYYTKPYTATFDFNITWTGRIAPAYQVVDDPRQFNIQMENYDFELHRITATITKFGGALAPVDAAFKIRLYDAWGMALSNAPVVDVLITENTPFYNSCFPVPTLLYPASSIIRFDIQSLLLDTEVPAAVTLEFHGVQRFPVC